MRRVPLGLLLYALLLAAGLLARSAAGGPGASRPPGGEAPARNTLVGAANRL